MSGSFSYERYDTRSRAASRRQHSVLGFWIPITVTVTLAAGGLAAWAFRARQDHDATSVESDDENLSYGAADTDRVAGPRPPSYGVSEGVEHKVQEEDDSTIVGRVQSFVKRTPSPQQVFDGARKGVVAGVAAVGGMVGGALSAIREDKDEGAYEDHARWRRDDTTTTSTTIAGAGRDVTGGAKTGVVPGDKRRTIAIVISAEEGDIKPLEDEEDGWKSEHASLLSHIPRVNPNITNLVILIYVPRHQVHDSTTASANNPKAPSSLGSSYSAIPTPGEDLASVEPIPVTPALSARSSGSSYYDMLYKQASRLVSSQESIMPFSTLGGFTHMLKHLGPDVVYVSESLTGRNGENVQAIKGWVGQVIVVVGGDSAGLVETEEEIGPEDRKWWEDSDMVGLGKGVEVVDAIRVGDDWERRVGGKQ